MDSILLNFYNAVREKAFDKNSKAFKQTTTEFINYIKEYMFVIITGLFDIIYNNLIELPTLMGKAIQSTGEGRICRLDYENKFKISVEECETLSSGTSKFGIKIMSASIYEDIRKLDVLSSNYYNKLKEDKCELNLTLYGLNLNIFNTREGYFPDNLPVDYSREKEINYTSYFYCAKDSNNTEGPLYIFNTAENKNLSFLFIRFLRVFFRNIYNSIDLFYEETCTNF